MYLIGVIFRNTTLLVWDVRQCLAKTHTELTRDGESSSSNGWYGRHGGTCRALASFER